MRGRKWVVRRQPGPCGGGSGSCGGEGGGDGADGVGPEVGFGDIGSEGLAGGGFAGGAAGEGEEGFVAREEGWAFLVEASEEGLAEEVAEDVGEVVEGDPGDEEVHFGGPEHGVGAVWEEGIAVELALGLFHEFGEVFGGDLAEGSGFVERAFELVAHGDVEEIGVGAEEFLIEEPLTDGRGEVRGFHEPVEEDHFAEVGGGFGEGHGVFGGHGSGGAEDAGVPCVAGLVGEGDHVVDGAVPCHVDPFLAFEERACAEGAGALAGTGLGFDP